MNLSKTKKLTATAMLCALAYIAAMVLRIPIVLFLKYDPKDIIIVIGGLIWGPLTSLTVTVIVSVVQMFTISGTGIWGCVMNVISSCSFACTASFFYRKRQKLSGAVLGLLCGCICQAAVMMLWNYLIAPIYMGYPKSSKVNHFQQFAQKHYNMPAGARKAKNSFLHFCLFRCVALHK